MNVAGNAIAWAEQGRVPDLALRRGIRLLLKQRLAELPLDDCEATAIAEHEFVGEMDHADIAPLPQKANEQHYELPPAFFETILGSRRKYSCCYWPAGVESLDAAEAAALELTCQRADLDDGMDILELGCGWGSLSLWIAERYTCSHITAVSNAHAQAEYIRSEARRRRLNNVRVITCDMNDFAVADQFDRVVSVEMFEHMRNYRRLLERIHRWLRPGGKFFMHIFCHRCVPYAFEDRGPDDWMSRYFFSGGIMPSDGLPLNFQEHLKFRQRWRWHGRHYARTANAWLHSMDSQRTDLMPILRQVYGNEAADIWWTRWRLFFMACAELFDYNRGQEWWVSHYLFERPGDR